MHVCMYYYWNCVKKIGIYFFNSFINVRMYVCMYYVNMILEQEMDTL